MSEPSSTGTDVDSLQHLNGKVLQTPGQPATGNPEGQHLNASCRALLSQVGRRSLTLILNPLEQILHGGEESLSPTLRSELERIYEHSTYLRGVIEQVDELAQAQTASLPPDVRSRDLIAFLRTLLQRFKETAAGLQVSLYLQAGVERLPLPFSGIVLSKALSHLIGFALARTPAGGVVQVVVAPDGLFDASHVTVMIRDTGAPLSPSRMQGLYDGLRPVDEQADELPDPILDLAILSARQLLGAAGIKLSLDDTSDGGTTVSVWLPRAAAAYTNAPAAAPAKEPDLFLADDHFPLPFEGTPPLAQREDRSAAPAILLVHESPEVRAYLCACLAPYRIFEAREGAEALRLIRRERPNLIVCSLSMPAIGGTRLLRSLKADPQFAGIPFIALSNTVSEEHRVRLLNAGAVAYLVEPFRVDALRAVIRNLLAMEQREMEMRALAQHAQLAMLRYQLNPHFLFNALNAIRALVISDGMRARQMVTALSEYLRYSLRTANDLEVSLQEEVASVVSYLEIEKIRFEEDLEIELDIQKDALSCTVPGVLLQPLVENAVKYGMATSPMPMQIRILGRRQNRRLYLEVANTGHWIPPEQTASASTGIGLTNLSRRLAQYYPARHHFDIGEHDGWVKATITIVM